MTGLFGYYSQHPRHEKILEIAKTIEYTIKDVKASEKSLVCRLDITSNTTNNVAVELEKGGYTVFCGQVFDDIVNPMEFIHEAYKQNDFSKLHTINGSFIAAIFDERSGKLTLINDRFGSKKLFYFSDQNGFYFSPKIAPLMKLLSEKKIRKDAVADFFIFGYYLGDKTFDESIHQLPPASVLEISTDVPSVQKYWTYEHTGTYDKRDIDALIHDLGSKWQKAMDRRLTKEEKSIIQLSGGLDSRAILAAALKSTGKDNIILYTFGDERSYDFEIGTMIAKKLGMHHITLRPTRKHFADQYLNAFHDNEGMIDATPYYPVEMSQVLGEAGKKIYNGYLGGEIMGPLIFPKILDISHQKELPYEKAKEILLDHHKINDIRTIEQLLNQSYLNQMPLLSSFEKSIEDLPSVSPGELPTYCARWLYLNESDKYTWFCNVRYRSKFYYYTPFLDNEVVDFMLRIPPELRIKKLLYKKMLLHTYPELLEMPTKHYLGLSLQTNQMKRFVKRVVWFFELKLNQIATYLLHHDIFFNKNENFVNYDNLLRTNPEYQQYVKSMIDKVKKREFFDPEFIDSLWKRHINGKKNYARLFGLLVSFELILETYYDS